MKFAMMAFMTMIIMMVMIDYDEKMLMMNDYDNDDDEDIICSSPVLKNLHLHDNSSWPSKTFGRDKDVKLFLVNYILEYCDEYDDHDGPDDHDNHDEYDDHANPFRGGNLTSRLSLKELNDRLEKYIGSMEMLPEGPHHIISRWTWW